MDHTYSHQGCDENGIGQALGHTNSYQGISPAKHRAAGEGTENEPMSVSPFIDIQKISYTYPARGKGKDEPPPALSEVNLQLAQGEYLALLGHNGSGKSTLARHCNALLVPSSGRVLVAGLDTSDKTKQRSIRDRVGMIFQNP